MDIFSNLIIKSKFIEEKIKINPILEKIYLKSQNRTYKDLNILYDNLKNLKFFQKILSNKKYGELMYRTIIKRMEIKTFEAGEAIYRVKEPISSLFIILEGKIVVYKPPKKYLLRGNKKKGTKRLKFIEKIVWSFKNSISAHVNKEPDYYLFKGDEYGFDDMKKLKREVLTETRSFTVIGEISRNDYILIFEKTEFLEKHYILDFLSEMKIFSSYIYGDFLSNLYNIMKKKIIFKGEYLCKKGDKFDKLFIIINGNFQVYLNSLVKMKTIYDLSSFDKNKEISRGSAYNMNFELKNYYNEKYEYKIVEYGKGQIIGDIEYTNQTDKYLFSIICEVDNSQILEIPLSDFNDFVTKGLYNKIKSLCSEKIKTFKKRIEEIRNVNKKAETKQNKYRDIIINKINKSKGKILDKMDLPKSILEYKNTKKKIVFTLRRKETTFSNDKMMNNNDYFSLNYTSRHNRNFSLRNNYTEFPSLQKNDNLYTEPPLKILKYYNNHSNNRNFSAVKLPLNSMLPTSSTRESNSLPKKKTILFEKDKNNFSNCFEISKKFYLNHNISIINKDLKKNLLDV